MAKDQIQIEFKVLNQEFNKAMKEMSSEVTKLNKEFRLEQEQLRVNGTEKEKLESRVNYLNKRYQQQQKEVQATKEHLDQAKKTFGENSEEVQKLENKLSEAQRKEAYFANEVQLTSKELEKHTDKFQVLGRKMEDFGGKLQSVGGKMKDIGKGLSMRVTAPIVAAGGAIVKLGSDFEKEMSGVQSVTGATGDELEQLENSAREAGATTNKSATEAAEALKYMGLAGWGVKDSQEALMPILKLSSAGNIDLGKTSDLVTDSMGAMGIEIEDLDDYLNVMAQTSRNSNTEVDQLAEAFLNAGNRTKNLKIPVEETATALGILGNEGMKGAEGGRALDRVLGRLTAPTENVKKEFKELGIEMFDAQGEFLGLETALGNLEKGMAGMNDEQKNAFLSMVAGKEHSKALGTLLDNQGEKWDDLKGKVDNADGALNEMYETSTDNLQGRLDTMKSSLEELALKFYEGMQEPLSNVVEKITEFIQKLQELNPEQVEMILKIAGIAAVVGPLLIVLGSLAGAVGNIIGVVGKILPVFGKIFAVGKTLLVGLSTLTGVGLGPLILIIGAVVAAGVYLYKNWDKIKEKAAQLVEWLSEKWEAIKETTVAVFTAVKDFISDIWNSISEFFSTVWEGIKNIFLFAVEFIKSILSSGFEIIKAIIRVPMEIIKSIFTTIWNYIGDFVLKTWDKIKSVISKTIEKVKSVIEKVMNTIKSVWEAVWAPIRDFVVNTWEVISTKISGVINSIKSVISRVMDTIKNVMTNVWNTIKTVTSNVWNAIKNAISAPINAVKDIVSNVINGIKDTVSNVWDSIKSVTSSVWDGIKTAITTPIEAAKNTISGIIDSIKGFFSNLKLEFPKISMPKLPKFSLEGKFSLAPPSVPRVSVKWNKLGGIFTKPTIFNTPNAGLQGVGEAGAEAILPISHLAEMIRDILFPMLDRYMDITALAAGGGATFNFNGDMTFRDRNDVDYLMNEMELILKRRGY